MKSWQEIHGYFDFADLYDQMVEQVTDRAVFVELGVYHGQSLIYLAQRVQQSGKPIQIFGVDLFGVGQPRVRTPPQAEVQQNLVDCGVDHLVHLIGEDSAKAANRFPDGSVDFVFIDADHRYEFVVKDIQAWKGKVRAGGVIAGHDRPRPGVARAVRETLGRYKAVGPSSWMVTVSKE